MFLLAALERLVGGTDTLVLASPFVLLTVIVLGFLGRVVYPRSIVKVSQSSSQHIIMLNAIM
jgi:hypothetical protein